MAKTPLEEEIFQIYNYCRVNCSINERWPSYYRRRYLEFRSYLDLLPTKQFDTVLELGCGIGYQSAFLSKISTKVIATDLEEEDLATHAPGMKKAKSLHDQLNIKNVELIPCSAEELPFADQSFDMVYSSHVLEHIPDRSKALKEIYRVLKPGGIHFCVVPTTMEKIYAFFNFYTYLLGRSLFHLFQKIKAPFQAKKKLNSSNVNVKPVNSNTSLLKYFPFPPPHGESSHYLQELINWTPRKWSKCIIDAAPFVLISQSTTQLNPLLSLLGGILPKLGTACHAISRVAELTLGKWPVLNSLGVNTVMIFKKSKEEA
ncbi:MAG: class I SAM-dependent methyltransferase [Bacteroidetes bacterium]|nr:class I SAM-dependent methyltransferase [Bacteroidota bacterium]